ncbi:MAG TPA: hypothetical protein VMT67_06065 [Terriglobales bacterium]|nr:hypothetical protein [Terriglobales bacterium]
MKLTIDNLDGLGAQDYSAWADMTTGISVRRTLNAASELRCSLLCGGSSPAPPVSGARVVLVRDDGTYVFTGYLTADPSCEYLGWAGNGPQYRYDVLAESDVALLAQKTLTPEPSFVARSAGSALSQLTVDLMPNWFDLQGIEAGDPIPELMVDGTKEWAALASAIGVAARSGYRDENGRLLFAPLGERTYGLREGDPAFSPDGLQLERINRLVNDATVVGEMEPTAHVKDYFVGDGYTTTFYMSEKPFTRGGRTILNEEYLELDPTHWTASGPPNTFSVSNGQLQVAGGTGQDGQAYLQFIEQVELGGTTVLLHGDVAFSAISTGIIGGLYDGDIAANNCVAGFKIAPAGSVSSIQGLIGGVTAGTVLETKSGHHYVLATYLYPTEVYRMGQVYHSSLHPSGNARGGAGIACDVRVVLQVQDIDPANPGTQVAPALVLYDGMVKNAPGFCTYALINATSMQCAVTFTYLYLATDAVVRATPDGGSTVTLQAGSLISGAVCRISTTPALQFYPEYIPAQNEAIEVSYRCAGRAMARVVNSASILAHHNGADDGVRGHAWSVGIPATRTSADCETAALALLDDAGSGWTGEYRTWSKMLPEGAEDIFAGDGLAIQVPSQGAGFLAIVTEAELNVVELSGEAVGYRLKFVDAGDSSLGFGFAKVTTSGEKVLAPIDVTQVGMTYLEDLTNAEVTAITSTTVTIDAGYTPPAGGGIEVRYSDTAWGAGNNRNLIGRYSSSTFTLPRYARGQSYFLRGYDNSTAPRYSRYSTALYVDYPL